jgi:hypothetical protein
MIVGKFVWMSVMTRSGFGGGRRPTRTAIVVVDQDLFHGLLRLTCDALAHDLVRWLDRRALPALVDAVIDPMGNAVLEMLGAERLDDEIIAAGGHAGADVLGGLTRR